MAEIYVYNKNALDFEEENGVNDFNLTITLTDDGGPYNSTYVVRVRTNGNT